MEDFSNLTKIKEHLSPPSDDGGCSLVPDKTELGKFHKATAGGDLLKLNEFVENNDIDQPDQENRWVGLRHILRVP